MPDAQSLPAVALATALVLPAVGAGGVAVRHCWPRHVLACLLGRAFLGRLSALAIAAVAAALLQAPAPTRPRSDGLAARLPKGFGEALFTAGLATLLVAGG